MLPLLRHRGPDDTGLYVDDEAGIALGATRLSIIDVAGGHQPIANEDGTVWACSTARSTTSARCASGSRPRAHASRTRSDTEVLVHLYEEYGGALVHALDGMFAFAIWDARTRTAAAGARPARREAALPARRRRPASPSPPS